MCSTICPRSASAPAIWSMATMCAASRPTPPCSAPAARVWRCCPAGKHRRATSAPSPRCRRERRPMCAAWKSLSACPSRSSASARSASRRSTYAKRSESARRLRPLCFRQTHVRDAGKRGGPREPADYTLLHCAAGGSAVHAAASLCLRHPQRIVNPPGESSATSTASARLSLAGKRPGTCPMRYSEPYASALVQPTRPRCCFAPRFRPRAIAYSLGVLPLPRTPASSAPAHTISGTVAAQEPRHVVVRLAFLKIGATAAMSAAQATARHGDHQRRAATGRQKALAAVVETYPAPEQPCAGHATHIANGLHRHYHRPPALSAHSTRTAGRCPYARWRHGLY